MFSENETIPTMGSYYTVNKIQFCASQRNNSYCFVMICRCLCWAIKALMFISNIRYLNEFLKTKWLCLCFPDVCNSVPYCTREEHSSHLNRKKCNDSLWSRIFYAKYLSKLQCNFKIHSNYSAFAPCKTCNS